MPAIESRGDYVLLRVRVQPRAAQDRIAGERGGAICIALSAPPVDGAANAAVCAFVAKRAGIARGSVRIERGEKSRDKVLRIEGVCAEDLTRALGV